MDENVKRNDDDKDILEFKKKFNEMLSIFQEITRDENPLANPVERETKIQKSRDIWIDLMMQMQENEGLEAMSTPKYFQILNKLNQSVCFIAEAN